MVYTPLTKSAILFAFDAHRGQYDKSGLSEISDKSLYPMSFVILLTPCGHSKIRGVWGKLLG